MLRVRKYLKPYIFPIILAIMLLFCQGMSDLYLPNLMSDIVNTGIQRSGIEHAAPEAVSSDGMNMILNFMKEDQRKLVEDSYILIDKNSSNLKKYREKYSYLDDSHSIYVLKDNVDIEKLDDAVSRSELALVFTLQGIMSALDIDTESNFNNMSDDVDMSKLYSFASMPADISEKYIEKANDADPMISEQVGTAMAKQFYKELGVDVAAIQNSYILHIGLLMVLVTIGGVIATILVSFIASKISAGVARTMRSHIFRKVESFSNEEFDKFSTASLITRTTNDITQIQNIINMGLRMICYAPIMGIGGAILAASTTMSMSWIIIAAIGVLLAVMLVVFVVAMPKFKMMQKLIDRLNLVTRESLSGLLVIRAFGTERQEEERFDKANKDLTDVNLFVNRVMTFLMPVMTLIMNGVSMLVVWVGAHRIEQAEMQVGDMMAFIQYSMMIIMSFLMIAVMFIIIPRASVSATRIADVLECDISIKDPENPVSLKEKVKGEVKFDNVSFRYKGANSDVLRNISFTANPGETTAFIGTTGSGKTTLVNLIPRFYDVTEGKITLDGIDVRDLTQRDLREQIGLVPQKGMLFSGDIASNLRYGRNEATDDEIKKATETAQATEFIESKPDKYASPIAQGGSNVSGGQKQRLAIARALTKKAPIYIFDDSFSALDFKTDAALRKALKKYTGNSTVIIVAQRISTIMYAENIIVLDEGRIVGRGTHNELLKNCKAYRDIAVSQNITQEV